MLILVVSACSPQLDTPIQNTETYVVKTQAASATPRLTTPGPTPIETPTQPIPEPTQTDTLTPIVEPTSTATIFISPTPTRAACLDQGGQITKHTLSTELSPWPWEFRVYTPPCYHEQPEKSYPLLILIHGSTFNDDQWDRLGADEMVDKLVSQNEIPPFIILMPRDRVWREPDEDPFGTAVVDYILPWVEENYRTIPDRSYRAIGGLSRGASWAIHLGLSRWELFGAIGGHSPPVFWSDVGHVRTWLDSIPPDSLPRIYLDIGEKDYLIESATWFENVLTEKGIPHEWYLFSGRHEEDYWITHLEKYIRWYAIPWQTLP